MKRVLAFVLTLILAFSMASFAAFAEDGSYVTVTNEALEYGKKGNVISAKATIVINENANGALKIPLDFLNQFEENVTMPGDAFTYYFTIENHSQYHYSYQDGSFRVTVGGNMNDEKDRYFYSNLFSVSFTRELNMASSKDTDCGIANYLDSSSAKYAEANEVFKKNLNVSAGAKSGDQLLYIGLNGPLMGNPYMNYGFGGNMELVLQQENAPAGKTVTVSVVTPKRMSIRLLDGTVLKNGDSFQAKIGEAVYFAMCSNNWNNDTYDDHGNGVMGTVVYSVTVADSYTERSYDADSHAFVIPKGDLTLRTDTNRCFMAYRFYFEKAQYNKQTGIKQVVDPELESLSVNLPLGSTITADAYIAQVWQTSANVFIETAEDKTISYTNYIWEGM